RAKTELFKRSSGLGSQFDRSSDGATGSFPSATSASHGLVCITSRPVRLATTTATRPQSFAIMSELASYSFRRASASASTPSSQINASASASKRLIRARRRGSHQNIEVHLSRPRLPSCRAPHFDDAGEAISASTPKRIAVDKRAIAGARAIAKTEAYAVSCRQRKKV